MAGREEDPRVLAAIAYAFGHLGAPHGHDWLLEQRSHPDDGVREAVAFALGGRPGEDALEALIALSADAEPAVRDWATFALGTLAEQDSPALREALAARLDDADEDTRLEADPRARAARRRARRGAGARPDRRASSGDTSVWRRHLISETADRVNDSGRRVAPRGN